jgi:hypothetical protein
VKIVGIQCSAVENLAAGLGVGLDVDLAIAVCQMELVS